MFIFDPNYIWLVIIPSMILGFITQNLVKGAYAKYSAIGTRCGITGADVARRILDKNGLYDIHVEVVPGHLTDHYDPQDRVLRLSLEVYKGRSIAAVGIAAHEAGHALQHANTYIPLFFRNQIYPIANFGTNLAFPLVLFGFVIANIPAIGWLGIWLYVGAVVFSIVTLPVEFNASARAMAILRNEGYIVGDEMTGVKKVLGAAALTYVAATLTAILTLLHLLGMRHEE